MTAGPGDLGDTRTLQDPLAEALRVVDLADAKGLLVRLMGGMAIRAHAPDWPARTRRVEVDLDFATRGKDRGAFYELLANEGYTPDKRHNALFGGKQAYFVDVARNRPVDVLVDSLEMCHRFEFKDRLGASTPTLPLAELLLSKLQIVKINRKDVLDAPSRSLNSKRWHISRLSTRTSTGRLRATSTKYACLPPNRALWRLSAV